MRCYYCGWNNDSGASSCVKCRRPLTAYEYNPPIVGYPGGDGSLPRETVIGTAGVAGAQQPAHPTVLMGNEQSENGSEEKDKGLSIDDFTTECEHCHKEIPARYSFCPFCGGKMELKTILPGRRRKHKKEKVVEPECTLTLLPDEDEDIEAAVLSYKGASVMLNRANTEPDNLSITSKEQAELVCEEGVWSIVNHSEMCTTCVEASRKIALQPGDVIVLGDRRFQFSDVRNIVE